MLSTSSSGLIVYSLINGSHSGHFLPHLKTNPIDSTYFRYPLLHNKPVSKFSGIKQQWFICHDSMAWLGFPRLLRLHSLMCLYTARDLAALGGPRQPRLWVWQWTLTVGCWLESPSSPHGFMLHWARLASLYQSPRAMLPTWQAEAARPIRSKP